MQKRETAIEVKVGALVLISFALLVAFVIILGDFSLEDGHIIYVDYDNAAGLKPGADVAISGIKAGQVHKLEFMGGAYDESVGREVMVRAHLKIDKDMSEAIRTDSEFYITTQGVLGEKYVEIITTSLKAPAAPVGSKMRGIDPPRMEILLAKGAELLTEMTDLLSRDDIPVKDLIRNTNSLMAHTDELVVENRDTLRSLLANADTVSGDAIELVEGLRDGVGDGSEIRAALVNTRSLTGKLNRSVDPLVGKATRTLDAVESVATTADEIATSKRPQIEGTIDNVFGATEDLKSTSTDVQSMVSDIRAGRGSIGGLVTDEEIYDDLKEMLRELKRRPWKIIWKE